MLVKISDEELENIIGGEFMSASMIMAYLTLFATLVAVYKIYNSTKGKAKFGNDFTFEWS